MEKIDKLHIGWKEWVALPDLKIPAIKAKIDTGAKTSSLHAFDICSYTRNNKEYVKFSVHPLQKNTDIIITCNAPVVDKRRVTSSNGATEKRYVIKTKLNISNLKREIELTLSNREPLRFRMLLGREALQKRVIIDPCKSHLITKYKNNEPIQLYL